MDNEMHNGFTVDEEHLSKPFIEATRDDIRNLLKWMEQKEYKASTNEKSNSIDIYCVINALQKSTLTVLSTNPLKK